MEKDTRCTLSVNGAALRGTVREIDHDADGLPRAVVELDKRNRDEIHTRRYVVADLTASGEMFTDGIGEPFTPTPEALLRFEQTPTFDYSDSFDGREVVKMATCGTCGRSWNDAAISSRTPAPSGRCPFEYDHDDTRNHFLRERIARGRREHGERFDPSELLAVAAADPDGIGAYYGTGARVRVIHDYGAGEVFDRTGIITTTTGWRPAFMLKHRANASGSWDLLTPNDRVVQVQRGRKYVDRAEVTR